MRDVLLIFIKNPVKGNVKTRIAKTAGEDEALRIYFELLQHTRVVTQNLLCDKWLFYDSFVDEDDAWDGSVYTKMVQSKGSLGERMENAFKSAFRSYTKAIIIGSDCLQISENLILDAFNALEQYAYVVGPANDGGYYLLGMTSHTPALFKNKTWSSPKLFTETIDEIVRINGKMKILPYLSDIDTEEEWNKR